MKPNVIRGLHRLLLTIAALWAWFWFLVFVGETEVVGSDAQEMALWLGLGMPGAVFGSLYLAVWTRNGFRQL